MAAMAAQSARDAAAIKRLYRPHLELLLLNGYSDLEGALATGGLAPLPAHPGRFNLAPRLDGPHPIGEKDLDNQVNYLAARPATIGALIVVASRVRSGPVEITSLVRHAEYQAVLKATNGNATTSVPMHTMGLAFDIALVNTPLARVQEIRRVLRADARRRRHPVHRRAAAARVPRRAAAVAPGLLHRHLPPGRGRGVRVADRRSGRARSAAAGAGAPDAARRHRGRRRVAGLGAAGRIGTAAAPRTADTVVPAARLRAPRPLAAMVLLQRTARVPRRARHVRLANRQSFVIAICDWDCDCGTNHKSQIINRKSNVSLSRRERDPAHALRHDGAHRRERR